MGCTAVKIVWPHEFFRLDFDQMLEEGRRQEEINAVNAGEYRLIERMHAYFDSKVLSLIINDDWVFEAASKFANDYAIDCFHLLRLAGQEAFVTQKSLLDLNRKTIDFLARAYHVGAAPLAGTVNLPKASDFITLVKPNRLPPDMRSEAISLYEQAKDHEILQLRVTLRTIRSFYENSLPRIMYVVRRVIKINLDLPPKQSDSDLTGISEYITWYSARVDNKHPLYPVLGELQSFFKIARNVGSHHQGLKWDSDKNEVILVDNNKTLRMPTHKFQQKYRHLSYLCELGLRGILSAFCARERGEISNWLVREYVKTFPEDFPEGERGKVRPYS
jgi:hypothetical protein